MDERGPWGGEIPEDEGEAVVYLARDVDRLEAGQRQLWRELEEVAGMARSSERDVLDALLEGVFWSLGFFLAHALVALIRGKLADGEA